MSASRTTYQPGLGDLTARQDAILEQLQQLQLNASTSANGNSRGPVRQAGNKQQLLDDFLAACRRGDHELVRSCLARPGDRQFLVHDGKDQHGNTALIVAAAYESPRVLQLLLDHGSKVNYQSPGGDCALGEAAAFAQLQNVHILLDYGAAKHLKNSKGRIPVDHANHPDRDWYHEYRAELKEEHPALLKLDDLHRERIVQLLRPQQTASTAPQPTSAVVPSYFDDLLFDPVPAVGNVLKSQFTQHPVEDFQDFDWDITQWKTFATLIEPGLHLRHAMSGWSHGNGTTISGQEWTQHALKVTPSLPFTFLALESRDQGTPGQYYASHAEVQLMVYYMVEHRTPSPESEPLKSLPNSQPFHVLILVSRETCVECRRFQKAVNAFTQRTFGYVFEIRARFRDPYTGAITAKDDDSSIGNTVGDNDSVDVSAPGRITDAETLLVQSRAALQEAREMLAKQKHAKSPMEEAKELIRAGASGTVSQEQILKSLNSLSTAVVEIAEAQKSLTAMLGQKTKL